MTTPADRSRLIRAAALRHGFHHVGIAEAREVRHADEFRAWLAEGRHAGMSYMEDRVDERLDPETLDPAYQTIVSVAVSYYQDDAASAASRPAVEAPTGRIARYARGADYHNVLGKRLRKLLAELRAALDGCDGRAWVDTGPVMDRAWAMRAGLGWWGKHTNLVSRVDGSWLVLGTMALTVECEPDEPHEDFCGSCRRCLDACPTNAIVAERELDARLCISYWTIEHRGRIPEAMRPAIGDWIFGCDLCLDVCPWNRFAQAGREAKFAAREDRAAPALEPLLALDEAAFREKFNGSPIQRATRDGFVRNVCVALGNIGTLAQLPALERTAANDPSEVVREHARWGIQRITDRQGG